MNLSLLDMCVQLAATWREWEANIDSRGSSGPSDYGECAVMLENILDHHRAALARQAQPDYEYDKDGRLVTVVGALQAQPEPTREQIAAASVMRPISDSQKERFEGKAMIEQELDDAQVWVDTNGPDDADIRDGETFTTDEF